MSIRDEILSTIGSSVAGAAKIEQRRSAVRERIAAHANGTIPVIGKSKAEIVNHFVEKAKAADATVVSVKKSEIGKAISSYLREHNLPQALKCGDDTRLSSSKKQLGKLVEISTGRSHGEDLVSLSHAMGGVAETGTLLMVSGADNPTTLNFLPENHIVLIQENDIHSSYEVVLDQVRKTYGLGSMPRTVNMITGPSRSADIEQTLILGAHGPVRLHVIVVKD